MQAKSVYSRQLDPYKAGFELGQAFAPMAPEVVFLFPTIHYGGSPELAEGLYDAVGRPDMVLFGNSGDGCFAQEGSANIGVSALALNSDARVRWRLGVGEGLAQDPEAAVARCWECLPAEARNEASIFFAAADFRSDSSALIHALRQRAAAPIVGGLAADSRAFKEAFVFANREVYTDSVVLLAAQGALAYTIHLAHTFERVGKAGVVTRCAANHVQSIDDQAAMRFVEAQLGKHFVNIDEGITAFQITRRGLRHHLVRSLRLPTGREAATDVKLFGSIEEGDRVHSASVHLKRSSRMCAPWGTTSPSSPSSPWPP